MIRERFRWSPEPAPGWLFWIVLHLAWSGVIQRQAQRR